MGLKLLNRFPNWVKSEANGVMFKTQLKFYLTKQAWYSVEKFFEPYSFESTCF